MYRGRGDDQVEIGGLIDVKQFCRMWWYAAVLVSLYMVVVCCVVVIVVVVVVVRSANMYGCQWFEPSVGDDG